MPRHPKRWSLYDHAAVQARKVASALRPKNFSTDQGRARAMFEMGMMHRILQAIDQREYTRQVDPLLLDKLRIDGVIDEDSDEDSEE